MLLSRAEMSTFQDFKPAAGLPANSLNLLTNAAAVQGDFEASDDSSGLVDHVDVSKSVPIIHVCSSMKVLVHEEKTKLFTKRYVKK